MKLLKFITPVLLLLPLLASFTAPARTYAVDVFNLDPDTCTRGGSEKSSTCQADGATNPISGKDGIIPKAARLVAFLTGVAAVIMVAVGGLRYIFSRGNSDSISRARSTIVYGLVGAVIAAIAQAVVIFATNRGLQ